MRRLITRLAVAGAALPAAVVPMVLANPAPASAAASYAYFAGDGVRIRSCASTSCGVVGLGYRSHLITAYCATYNAPYFKYVKDWTTGAAGWSASYLVGNSDDLGYC